MRDGEQRTGIGRQGSGTNQPSIILNRVKNLVLYTDAGTKRQARRVRTFEILRFAQKIETPLASQSLATGL